MIVLDTHAWLWWVSDPELLSPAARQAVEEAAAAGDVHVSSISTWEVAMLVKVGRLRLSMPVRDWIRKTEALPFLTFHPVDNAVALRSIYLPGRFHNDPADRIIVATAIELGAPLVTKDAKIRDYPFAPTVW